VLHSLLVVVTQLANIISSPPCCHVIARDYDRRAMTVYREARHKMEQQVVLENGLQLFVSISKYLFLKGILFT
jgi:hypothetical protein